MENPERKETVPMHGFVTVSRAEFDSLVTEVAELKRENKKLWGQINKILRWQSLIMGGIAVGAWLLGYGVNK